MLLWHHKTASHSGVQVCIPSGCTYGFIMELYIIWMEPNHSLSKCCRNPSIFIVKCSPEISFFFNFSKSCDFQWRPFFSHFFVPIELSNLNLKTYCLFTILHRNIFFLEDSIVNLILSHVSEANFVYFFCYDFLLSTAYLFWFIYTMTSWKRASRLASSCYLTPPKPFVRKVWNLISYK